MMIVLHSSLTVEIMLFVNVKPVSATIRQIKLVTKVGLFNLNGRLIDAIFFLFFFFSFFFYQNSVGLVYEMRSCLIVPLLHSNAVR